MSAILSADDLNDFISPGVACIKPVETLPPPKPKDPNNPYEVTTEDQVDAEKPPPAQISLTDCLACSGCVTSAEAVLVSLQSHAEVLTTLDSHPSIKPESFVSGVASHGFHPDDGKIFIASVSPQTRASLAAVYGITEKEAGCMIEQLLSGPQGIRQGGKHGSGFTWVIDTNVAREACLVLGADEVSESLSQSGSHRGTTPKRPILTSACPGWICYAEKTHPHSLPHLSHLKSPQALLGTLLKTTLSKRLGISPDRIWHLAIMPCFDKKLEASREELTDQSWRTSTHESSSKSIRDVDCVITTREILMLADSRGISLPSLPLTPLATARPPFPDPIIDDFLFPQATTANGSPESGPSGGYLYHILLTYQAQHPDSQIIVSRGRNADVVEYVLVSRDGHTLLKTARYYGFRNIQNLVRRLKPARASRMPGGKQVGVVARKPPGSAAAAANGASSIFDYAYIEVMACPGGCTNGGAQLKIEDVASLRAQSSPSRKLSGNGSNGADAMDLDTDGNDTGHVQLEGTRGSTTPPPAPTTTPHAQREWLATVDEAYFSSSSASPSRSPSPSPSSAHPTPPNPSDPSSSSSPPSSPTTTTTLSTRTSRIHSLLAHISRVTAIPTQKLVYTSYRTVDSDVGKTASQSQSSNPSSNSSRGAAGEKDMARVVELAGKVGGGW
ncbi:MAG: hypothetical protein M1819_000226 [Sarea resinae]|nr:MAG: hypothetical protein M1819_000226 [Sarea resinae]